MAPLHGFAALLSLLSGLVLLSSCAVRIPATAATQFVPVETRSVSAYEQRTLEAVNQYRLSFGLSPLQLDASLMTIAREHSNQMQQQQRMSHTGYTDRFRRAGRTECAENVGFGYAEPEKLIRNWERSIGHSRNMLLQKMKYLGVSENVQYVTLFLCD